MNDLKGERWLFSKEKLIQDQQRAFDLLKVSGPTLQIMARTAMVEFGMSPMYVEERRGMGPCVKSRTIPTVDTPVHTLPLTFQLMRASGLDEMIQAVHVVRGDMLFTGRPRPLVEDGRETTHHSVAMMRRYLPASLFAHWLRVYDMGPPGLLSSFGNLSKALPKDDELLCLKRAEMDIMDVEAASPEHDVKIIMGAMALLEALKSSIVGVAGNPHLIPSQE